MPRRSGAADLPEDVVRITTSSIAADRLAAIEDVVQAGVEAVEREPQRYDAEVAELRAAIDEGDASGVFGGDPFAEVRARYGLAGTPR